MSGRANNASTSSENVQVVVRCRPLNRQEIQENLPSIARVNEEINEVTIEVKGRSLTKTFSYDAAYGPTASQRDVYAGTVLPIVEEVLDGYNCTIFAYGQTGTGKTYTMEGNRDTEDTSQMDSKARLKASREAGIISRSINTIFERLSKNNDEYSVKVSHLEIYNEELRDLLNPDNKGLKMFEDPTSASGSITVRGLTEVNVYNPRDIFNVLEKSWKERATAETWVNHVSSRSHCIFSITIHIKERNIDGEDLLKVGKLNLVDLAGSENVGRSGMNVKVNGKQLEAGMINKSLLAFGRVITALVDQAPHIPYRESKLTRLLQDSLGGRTKTCIIATISPASACLDETIGTLEYAHRAKSIKNLPQLNARLSKKEFLGDYAKEIDEMRVQIDAMRRKDGVFLENEEYVDMMDDLRQKGEEIDILVDERKIKEKEMEELQEFFEKQTQDLNETQNTLSQVQSSLNNTEGHLNQTIESWIATKRELQEHKVLLEEHMKVEDAAHAEAAAVLKLVSASLADLNALYDRLALHANQSSAAFEDHREHLQANFGRTRAQLNSFISQYDGRLGKVSTATSEYKTSVQNSMDDNQELLKCMDEQCQNRADDMHSLWTRQQDTLAASLSALDMQSDTDVEKRKRWRADVIKQSETAIAQLVNTTNSYDNKTRQWTENKSTDLTTAAKAADEFNISQQESYDSLNSLATSQATMLAELEGKLNEFVQQRQVAQREFQSALLSQVSVAVASFLSKQEERTASFVGHLFQSIQEQQQHATEFGTGFVAGLEASRERLKAFVADYSSSNTSVQDGVKKMSDVTSGICRINNDQARGVHNTLVQHLARDDEMSTQAIDTQKALSTELRSRQETRITSQSEVFKTMTEQGTKHRDELADTLAAHSASLNSRLQSWADQIDNARTSALAFGDSLSELNSSTSTQLAEFSFAPYVGTASTPAKQQRDFPRVLSRTRGAAEIVAQFRNGGEPVGPVDPHQVALHLAAARTPSPALDSEELESSQPEEPTESSLPEEEICSAVPEPTSRPTQNQERHGVRPGRATSIVRQQPTHGGAAAARPALSSRTVQRPGRENPAPTKPALVRQHSRSALPVKRRPAQDVTNIVNQ